MKRGALLLLLSCGKPPESNVLLVPTATATAVPPPPTATTSAKPDPPPPESELPCAPLCARVLTQCPQASTEKCQRDCAKASKRVSSSCRREIHELVYCVLGEGQFKCKDDDFDVLNCRPQQELFRKCQSDAEDKDSPPAPPPVPQP
jgi:hypothetical protein